MNDLWNLLIKVVPAETLPTLALLAAAFFGVYYTKGLRDYSDAINDRTFISLSILIVAGFLLYWYNKDGEADTNKDGGIVILIPRFEDDERRDSETLFRQQVQAALQVVNAHATIRSFDGYIRDRKTAALTAGEQKVAAVIFQPKVVRGVKDTILWCFSVYLSRTESSKPYPPTSTTIEKTTLDDLSNSILGLGSRHESADGSTNQIENVDENNPLSSRIERLELKVERLQKTISALKISSSAVDSEALSSHSNPRRDDYVNGYALVIGVDGDDKGQLPRLQYSTRDAYSVAALFQRWGLQVVKLTNELATKKAIESEIDELTAKAGPNTLLIVYYAGSTFVSSNVYRDISPQTLVIPTADMDFHEQTTALTLESLVERLQARSQDDILLILDGCHGTFGVLPYLNLSLDKVNEKLFQIISGSQDNGLAWELTEPGGGAFTQTLVKHMNQVNGKSISTGELVDEITPDILQLTNNRQRPKLVRVEGTRDIILGPIQSAGAGTLPFQQR